MSENKIEKEQWTPSVNPWIMIIPVMLAVFIYVLDGTIGNVALPHMAGSFSATRDESMWILTSYLIAAGTVIPAVDFFSKVFGRKNFFIISILMFTIASMLCGMAKNIEFMIFARILQGFGGGGILPISQAIIIESFPKEKRGIAMSVFGMGVILAPPADNHRNAMPAFPSSELETKKLAVDMVSCLSLIHIFSTEASPTEAGTSTFTNISFVSLL